MKAELKPIQRLTITDAPGLDPITVYLEETPRPNAESPIGKVTITCHQKAWTASWDAMGRRSIADFIRTSPTDYLINKLGGSHEIHEKAFSGQALEAMAKKTILDCRRGRTGEHYIEDLSKSEARALYDEITSASIDSLEDCWQNHKLLSQIFGEEWFLVVDRAEEDNHHYRYLFNIICTIQTGLTELRAVA